MLCFLFPDQDIIHIANPEFDYANPFGGYTVNIHVSDGEFSDQTTMIITVDNTVNEAPDLAANHANVSEGSAVNSVIYTVCICAVCFKSSIPY